MRRWSLLLCLPLLLAADIQEAQRLLVTGRPREALNEFVKVTEETPSLPAGWIGLARSHAALGQCRDAVEIFPQWRQAGAYNARAALTEAWCWHRLGDMVNAIETSYDARRLKPNLAPALYLRALAQSALGDVDGMEDTLDELLFTRRGEVMVELVRAWDAVERGDEVEYLRATERLRVIESDYPSVGVPGQLRLMEAQRWLDVGNPDAAVAVLTEFDFQRANIPALVQKAEALRRQGKVELALSIFGTQTLRTRSDAVPQSIRMRILADAGEVEALELRMSMLDDVSSVDLLATGWYVARVRGDEAGMQRFAELWGAANQNPDRSLEQLIPFTLDPR